jgi:hypothetical protein
LVAPWEWREWFFDGEELQNRPLFQTVDIPRMNTPGPECDAFMAFVYGKAAQLDIGNVLTPATFRSLSGRLNQGVPWTPLDLSGLPQTGFDAGVVRQAIELPGGPGCHTADAPFVQTDENGSFSPFYEKELDARANVFYLTAHGKTFFVGFGPLEAGYQGHP